MNAALSPLIAVNLSSKPQHLGDPDVSCENFTRSLQRAVQIARGLFAKIN